MLGADIEQVVVAIGALGNEVPHLRLTMLIRFHHVQLGTYIRRSRSGSIGGVVEGQSAFAIDDGIVVTVLANLPFLTLASIGLGVLHYLVVLYIHCLAGLSVDNAIIEIFGLERWRGLNGFLGIKCVR